MLEILRAAREEAGFSQRALAKRLGVPPSWVAKVELGERRLDVIEFIDLVRALQRSPTKVFAAVEKAAR